MVPRWGSGLNQLASVCKVFELWCFLKDLLLLWYKFCYSCVDVVVISREFLSLKVFQSDISSIPTETPEVCFWLFCLGSGPIYCSCNLSSFDEVASWVILSFSLLSPSVVHTLPHLHPLVRGWSVCLCVKALAVISAVLAGASQRRRSLAEFSHTGTE